MRLVFIHIPKTAGSSVASYLEQKASGTWLRNVVDLDSVNPGEVWEKDFFAGHFTRGTLLDWVQKHGLSLDGVQFATMVRHPFEQLQSNLSFPFELALRGEAVHETWMKDMLECDTLSPGPIAAVLEKHPWIFNLQWQFLITGSHPDEVLSQINHVSIYPAVDHLLRYCCDVLGIERPAEEVHENRSSGYAVERSVMAQSPLRELIIERHNLDTKLFSAVVSRQLRAAELDIVEGMICPLDHAQLFESWSRIWPRANLLRPSLPKGSAARNAVLSEDE